MIGAFVHGLSLRDVESLCEHGWSDSSREPFLLETVRPGVFVAGDVRSESTKRVA